MINKLLLLTILILANPAIADTYLCISELSAGVKYSLTDVIDAGSGKSSYKVVIKETGLYEFGVDYSLLPKCTYRENGKPIMCEANEPYWAGTFIMNENNVFTLTRQANLLNSDNKEILVYAGKCAEI